ncbi:MAG: CHAD domain-containing protein [Acaryochloridaceae cyanobacterium RL_2_7]|nr:CHAD domain-containing protein [Acaryochloridaceae cyanobacterium RL_2_7]
MLPEPVEISSSLTLGDFAYQTIHEQFDYILAQEKGVIADQDPEYLHQMRVGLRRFQAAITVFKLRSLFRKSCNGRISRASCKSWANCGT